jgi:hypothetical protein
VFRLKTEPKSKCLSLLQASAELQGMKGMWSLRASSQEAFDTFLVVSFISETRILAMNVDDELEETEIDGFDSEAQTLFCHNAIHDQLVQVSNFHGRRVDCSLVFFIRAKDLTEEMGGNLRSSRIARESNTPK